MKLDFKRGSKYTRKSVGEVCYPGIGRPSGGDWDTGYVSVENNLIVFMNIGVPGTTGHDFDNEYDAETNTIIWYGKPKAHSQQPRIKKLIAGEITAHFFARWDSKNTEFIYLGVGSIVSYTDSVNTKQGTTIKFVLSVDDAKEIIHHSFPIKKTEDLNNNSLLQTNSSFVLEKHLEDYLCKNWNKTIFGNNYDIYEGGRQFQTDTGPLDILAYKKNKKEFLVIELKREQASDVALGQIQRYMGFIKKNIANNNEDVRGCIIATDNDLGLKNALSVNPLIDFYKYSINFSLQKIDNE